MLFFLLKEKCYQKWPFHIRSPSLINLQVKYLICELESELLFLAQGFHWNYIKFYVNKSCQNNVFIVKCALQIESAVSGKSLNTLTCNVGISGRILPNNQETVILKGKSSKSSKYQMYFHLSVISTDDVIPCFWHMQINISNIIR